MHSQRSALGEGGRMLAAFQSAPTVGQLRPTVVETEYLLESTPVGEMVAICLER
jgi:hypothetical protein